MLALLSIKLLMFVTSFFYAAFGPYFRGGGGGENMRDLGQRQRSNHDEALQLFKQTMS